MASYIDKQTAAYQRTINDAIAGKGLAKAISQLQERSRIRTTLPDKQPRPTITAKAGFGKRVSSGSGTSGGIDSPLTERATTRTFFSQVRELTSTDGLFVLEYVNVRAIFTRDAIGRDVTIIFDDPDSW